MYDFEKYIGIPFVEFGRSMKGVDCYGLVWLVYKQELGIELPDYDERVFGRDWEGASKNHFLKNINEYWEIVKGSNYHLFDCHIFTDSNGVDSHIGLNILHNRFIHCVERWSVVVGKLDIWKVRLVETVRMKNAKGNV